MFQIDDRAEFFIPHAPHNQRPPVLCTIKAIGNMTYHAVDTNDNWFSSHHENFRLPVITHLKNEQRVIIGIAGRKGHGKDTAALGLEGFENVKFAGPIKAMARSFFVYIGMDPATIDRVVDGDMKETPLSCLGDKTSRQFQQVIGTEMGRDLIWDEIWINAAKMRADQFEKVAITDLRFPNEGQAIKAWGGKRMRLVDPRKPIVKGEHSSEDLVDGLEVEAVLLNDGTIEDLHAKVHAFAASSDVTKNY